MSDTMTETQEKYADRIAKLLRKAESTTSSEEAEALFQKAQQLMQEYAIDEELLARARGENLQEREQIIEDQLVYTGIYRMALYTIGSAITRANGCKPMITKLSDKTILWVVGFESDVRNVKLLNSSLELQAIAAMKRWWASPDGRQAHRHLGGMEQYKSRRQFIFGFADAISNRLYSANREAQRTSAEREAERSNVTSQEATESVALVVRSKQEHVQDWVDRRYGKLKSVPSRYSTGTYRAGAAGREAGQRADVGNPRVSSRKQLGGSS